MNIYDSKNTLPFTHQMVTCWGCDQYYNRNELEEDDIIECQQCPKTFHNHSK